MLRRSKWIIAFSLLLTFAVQAQDYYTWYQGGLTAKMVSSRMTISSEQVSTADGEAEIGFQIGGFFRVNIDQFYVEPQLLFSATKSQLVFQDFGGVPNFDPIASFEFNTLDLPIDIGIRFGNLRINTGPNLSFLLSGQRSFLNEVEKVTDEYNKLNMFWRFGLGADFDRIMVDLKYEFGPSKTGESLSNIIGTEFIPKQRQWIISVGFNLMDDF